jgi:cytochrome c556
MNAKITLLVVVALIAAGLALGQTKRNRAAKEFMREKLGHSQRVLEGIVTEDFDVIIAKGALLSAMTREADWRLFENPEYDEQSRLFRRHVEAIVKAARNKDADAATLAYVRMTMSCVDCHKLVRGKLVASTR